MGLTSKLLALLAIFLFFTGCGITPHPSDSELINRFHGNRAAFEEVVRMLEEDRDVIRVTMKEVFYELDANGSLTSERLVAYRRSMTALQLIVIHKDRDGLVFGVSERGWVVPSSAKSYLYSTTKPSSEVDSIDDVIKRRTRDQTPIQMKIMDNWYLDYESW